MDILNIIERIKLLPNAKVDRNYGQGREAVSKQLAEELKVTDEASVDQFITGSRERIAELIRIVLPYQLPGDYLSFLELYGGLGVDTETGDAPFFDVFGVGPMMEAWYADLVECNQAHSGEKIRQLYIGSWSGPVPGTEEVEYSEVVLPSGKVLTPFDEEYPYPSRYQMIRFYLDVAGDIQRHSILARATVNKEGDPRTWKKVAHSFTEWLEQLAATGGALEYIKP